MQQWKGSTGNHYVTHAQLGTQRYHDAGNKRYHLTQKLKQNIKTNHIPVILLTAKNSEKDYIEGLSLGADAYIAKPFNLEILITTIENLIRNREVLRNNFSGKQEQDGQIEVVQPQSADEKLMKK